MLLLAAVALYGQENNDSSGNGTNSSSSINFDGRMLAGLNGDSMYTVLMTQGLPNFAYQLNSSVIYTNDFGNYDNSSFISNDTVFNGSIGMTDYWKLIPEFELSNSTYGMFDNPYYSRENKDRLKFRLKNEYKPTPARWDLDLNFSRYDHKLDNIDSTGSAVEVDDTFYSSRGVLGMDYVWSASNKFGFRIESMQNDYPEKYKDDKFVSGELPFSFEVTEFVMLNLSPVVSWHNDGTDYAYFKGNVSTINIRHITIEFLYEHKLVPYDPAEEIYQKKYISIPYDLPSATVNHTEFNFEYLLNFESGEQSTAGVENLKFRFKSIYESSNNFYNYTPLSENIITLTPIEASFTNLKGELAASLYIASHKFDIESSYDYYNYRARKDDNDIRITYRPENIFSINIAYSGPLIEVTWENSLNDDVYINPGTSQKLDSYILGNLDFNIKLYKTFYLYSRINNLYNQEYYLRDGYPEPGIQFFTGLRIII